MRMYRLLTTLVTATGLALLAGCGGGGSESTTGTADTTTAGAGDTSAGETSAHVDPNDIPPTEAEIQALRDQLSTWDAAIAQIQEYRDTIRDETTAGTPAKAHRSLDMLDYVLQWLPEIAQSSNVPREQWETIGTNAQTLRDLFNQVHAHIDAGEDPDYGAVSDQIDEAVDALAAIEGQAAEPETTN